jgi:hypothetical protein
MVLPSSLEGYDDEFLLLHIVYSGSEVHIASYPTGAWGIFPGVKAAGA